MYKFKNAFLIARLTILLMGLIAVLQLMKALKNPDMEKSAFFQLFASPEAPSKPPTDTLPRPVQEALQLDTSTTENPPAPAEPTPSMPSFSGKSN